MTTVLHLSDLHFGPPFIREAAEDALRCSREVRPDVVVVSGDFTQRAKASQFAAAAEYLKRFEAPLVLTPGNHDVPLYRVWERFFAPRRLYRRYIHPNLNTVAHVRGAILVSLNSTRRLTLTNGRIREWQLRFAEQAFSDAGRELARVVVTHHHLAPPPDFGSGDVMPRARRALEAFTRLGVDLVLAGHMHRSYIGTSLDFFPGDLGRRGIVIVQCGTTTSRRGRGRERFRNTLNVIRVEDSRLVVWHFLWTGGGSGFQPASEHVFPRGARPYLEGPCRD